MVSVLFSWIFSSSFVFGAAVPTTIPAQIDPKSQHLRFYKGPTTQSEFGAWINGLKEERQNVRRNLDAQHSGFQRVYDRPALKWTQTNWIQTKAMVHDRYFFDSKNRKYTVDRFLDDIENRYGGVDSVLIWPSYPNIGIDSRNQFDLIRDLPGGLPALRAAIADFHQRGVRVFLPLNPWDNGTRDEGRSSEETIVQMVIDVGADGIFGDTMGSVERRLFDLGTLKGHDLAIETEAGVADDITALLWTPLSWGFMKDYQPVPGVARYKWIEPRNLTHGALRESHDHTDELQYAWFNGDGFLAWENIFGVWNMMTERDSEVVRRMSMIYRAFPEYFPNENWVPHTPTLTSKIFASEFPKSTGTIWTVINRDTRKKAGAVIPADENRDYFNLWTGEKLTPNLRRGQRVISLDLPAHGFAAIYATGTQLEPRLQGFLQKMSARSQIKIENLSKVWKKLPQKMVSQGSTRPVASAPAGMVPVPAVQKYRFSVTGIIIEDYEGAGVQFPWESEPNLEHDASISIPAFFIDRNLVTNGEFKKFMDASGYRPADQHGFLKHWVNGTYPSGFENKPVVWVSIEDARAYAAWAGKRLPNDWEWQYAAQGLDGRIYPWGARFDSARVPKPDISRSPRPPEDVGSFPRGASPFGINDMSGLVWQWTNEFQDEHNRRALVRGGSYYRPSDSGWYFPHQLDQVDKTGFLPNRLNEQGNYLLMDPTIDRSGQIGFRCVVDAAP